MATEKISEIINLHDLARPDALAKFSVAGVSVVPNSGSPLAQALFHGFSFLDFAQILSAIYIAAQLLKIIRPIEIAKCLWRRYRRFRGAE